VIPGPHTQYVMSTSFRMQKSKRQGVAHEVENQEPVAEAADIPNERNEFLPRPPRSDGGGAAFRN
jgi:hypothetical protein